MRVVLAGTSGTGKSTLLDALGGRGFQVFEEPQRAVLTEQLEIDGPDLPSKSPSRFLNALACRAVEDWTSAEDELSFYDRGLPDLLAYAWRFDVPDAPFVELARAHRYDRVFVLEPWREIFVQDAFRGLSFEGYAAFHERLIESYATLGYPMTVVPKGSLAMRVAFVLDPLRMNAG